MPSFSPSVKLLCLNKSKRASKIVEAGGERVIGKC